MKDAHTKTKPIACKDGFERTALVVEGDDGGSVLVVTPDGTILGMINIFYSAATEDEPEAFMVDVIDSENRYETKRGLVFSQTERKVVNVPLGGKLVAADFRGPVVKRDLCPLCGEDLNHPSQKIAAARRGDPDGGHRC